MYNWLFLCHDGTDLESLGMKRTLSVHNSLWYCDIYGTMIELLMWFIQNVQIQDEQQNSCPYDNNLACPS